MGKHQNYSEVNTKNRTLQREKVAFKPGNTRSGQERAFIRRLSFRTAVPATVLK